jgi:integrase/recombinase XerD
MPYFQGYKVRKTLTATAFLYFTLQFICKKADIFYFLGLLYIYKDVKYVRILTSELLGHSSIKITQEYYGKVVQKRVSEEMGRISRKLR